MSAPEPRLTSSEADGPPRGKAPAGGNGASAGGSVLVADSVEQALAAVQVQLARQAATALAPAVEAPAPVAPIAPVAPAPPPPPQPVARVAPAPPRRETARPRRARPVEDDLDDDEYDEAEFWGETRPRRRREVAVDPSTLTSAERRALGRLKARKVRRILRHVSPWSVFKVTIFFNLCLWLILMIAGVVLWKVAQQTPVLENIEKFYAKATGEKTFQLDGREIFRAAAGAGVILVLSSTAFVVLMSILFNLIADLTGGIRLSVIELESTRRPVRRRGAADQVRARAIDRTADEADAETDVVDAAAAPSTPKVVARRATGDVPAVTPAATSSRAASADAGDATAELKVLTRAGLDDRPADDAR